jgi:hypothetical protein
VAIETLDLVHAPVTSVGPSALQRGEAVQWPLKLVHLVGDHTAREGLVELQRSEAVQWPLKRFPYSLVISIHLWTSKLQRGEAVQWPLKHLVHSLPEGVADDVATR